MTISERSNGSRFPSRICSLKVLVSSSTEGRKNVSESSWRGTKARFSRGPPDCIFDSLRLQETTGARGTRPVRNHSQTVALVNQLLDRDTLQADSIALDKSEHFTHGFALCNVCSIRAPRSVFFTENLQSFANHLLEAVEVAGLQLFFDDLFLFKKSVLSITYVYGGEGGMERSLALRPRRSTTT
jgi:hypothetical protein